MRNLQIELPRPPESEQSERNGLHQAIALENTARGDQDSERGLRQEEVDNSLDATTVATEVSFCCKTQWRVCGLFNLTRADVASILILILVWLFVILIATPLDKSKIVGNTKFNEAAQEMLYPCSILFLIVGIVYVMVRMPLNQCILIVLTIIFVAAPAIYLSYYIPSYVLNWESVDAKLILSMGYIIFTYTYWIALKYTRYFCDYVCKGTFWGVCGVAAFCYVTVLIIMVLISSRQIFDVEYEARDEFASMVRYMLALLLLMVWGFIQYSCLYESYQQYQLQVERQEALQEREINRRAGILATGNAVELTRSSTMTYKTNCVYYGNLIGNALLGTCFVMAEVLMLDQFQTASGENEWELAATEIYITLFILLVMVVFVPLSASLIRYEDKQMYVFVFAGFCPVAILGGLYHPLIKDQETISGLVRMLLVFLPLFAMYVATLNYVRKHNDNIYRAYLTISGFGFILPSSVTYTLYYIGYYQIESTVVVVSIVFFSVSTVIIVVFFLVYVIMKAKETCAVGYKFKDCDFVDSGTLINVSGGIISVGVLVYVYVQVPDASTVKRSTVFAIMYLILFLTVCMNILLKIKVPKGIVSHHLNLYLAV